MATIHEVALKERYIGKNPYMSHLNMLGFIVYVQISDELCKNLDPKVDKCVLLGSALEQKVYKCYNHVTLELRVSRDVVFNEMSTFYGDI